MKVISNFSAGRVVGAKGDTLSAEQIKTLGPEAVKSLQTAGVLEGAKASKQVQGGAPGETEDDQKAAIAQAAQLEKEGKTPSLGPAFANFHPETQGVSAENVQPQKAEAGNPTPDSTAATVTPPPVVPTPVQNQQTQPKAT